MIQNQLLKRLWISVMISKDDIKPWKNYRTYHTWKYNMMPKQTYKNETNSFMWLSSPLPQQLKYKGCQLQMIGINIPHWKILTLNDILPR